MGPEDFMRRAIALAASEVEYGHGGPFGAVIVRDGAIIAEGSNQVVPGLDPTAHAEIVAIRRACAILGSFTLAGCDIYASCEPCPMCLAAIYWARLDRLYYGAGRLDAAAVGFDDDFLYRELPLPIDQRQIPTRPLLTAEARPVFAAWDTKFGKIAY